MSNFDMVRDMDAALFNEFSEEAIYNDQAVVNVIVDESVERETSVGETIMNAFEITFQRVQVPDLKRGDVVELGSKTLRVYSIVHSDHSLIVAGADIDSN